MHWFISIKSISMEYTKARWWCWFMDRSLRSVKSNTGYELGLLTPDAYGLTVKPPYNFRLLLLSEVYSVKMLYGKGAWEGVLSTVCPICHLVTAWWMPAVTMFSPLACRNNFKFFAPETSCTTYVNVVPPSLDLDPKKSCPNLPLEPSLFFRYLGAFCNDLTFILHSKLEKYKKKTYYGQLHEMVSSFN